MRIEVRQNSWLLTFANGVQLWVSHPKWWLIGITPAIAYLPRTS